MPLSTTNIHINPVSIPYRFRIVSVSFPYRSPIVLLSFSYCSPIVLLSFSYWEAENNTETIRNRTEDERMRNGGTRVVNLIISYDNGKTQTNYCGCKHVVYRQRHFPQKSLRYAFSMISEWHRNLWLTKKRQIDRKKSYAQRLKIHRRRASMSALSR